MGAVGVFILTFIIAIFLRLGVRRFLGFILLGGSWGLWKGTSYMEDSVTSGRVFVIAVILIGALLLFYPTKQERNRD